ncbi:CinA family nicotinamide mononucleotide deamidase-related protein [Bdellovibrionota bacterium FG-2]
MNPIIEILATGDEVVSGDVTDTNASFIAKRLSALGYQVTRHQAVPDDQKLITETLTEISRRSDICICSGGLGPTEDDLTTGIVSKLAGINTVLNEEAVARMRARASSRGVVFSESSTRSAWVPEQSEVYQNEVGAAPAFLLKIGRCIFFFLPGVPVEFHFFVEKYLLPWMTEHCPEGTSATQQLKTLGLPEASLAERFSDYSTLFPHLKVGYRAHGPEVWFKLSATGSSRQAAIDSMTPALNEARARLDDVLWGSGDEELALVVHELLLTSGLKLVTAESCSGGKIAHALTSYAGSSEYFLGGVVCYSNELKIALLGVSPTLLETHGAINAQCAQAMAEGALKNLGGDLAVSVTGLAGPTGETPGHPIGQVFVGLASIGQTVVVERRFTGNRQRVQNAATLTALEIVRRHLTSQKVKLEA